MQAGKSQKKNIIGKSLRVPEQAAAVTTSEYSANLKKIYK